MKKCPRCQKDISDTDQKCPHCGYILGYRSENNQPGPQAPRRRVSFVQRIIFYSLIAGFVFGPSFFNMYNNSSRLSGLVDDQSINADEVPLYVYTSMEAYQGDFPESVLPGKLAAFQNGFTQYLDEMAGMIVASSTQVTITNTSTAYAMAKYDIEVAGQGYSLELNYNSGNDTSSMELATSRYGILDLAALKLEGDNNIVFQQLSSYLGVQSVPLYEEIAGEFNALLDKSPEDGTPGRYGLGVTMHNNGSLMQAYYATDLVTGGDNPGYVLDLKFGGKINERVLGELR